MAILESVSLQTLGEDQNQGLFQRIRTQNQNPSKKMNAALTACPISDQASIKTRQQSEGVQSHHQPAALTRDEALWIETQGELETPNPAGVIHP